MNPKLYNVKIPVKNLEEGVSLTELARFRE